MPRLPRLPVVRTLLWLSLLLGWAALAHAATPAFDPVAETEKLLNTVPAAARAKSDAYFEGGYWLQLWDFFITIAFTVGLLQLGVIQRLRDWALSPKTGRRMLTALVFIVVWLGCSLILKLILPAKPDWWWSVRFVSSPVLGGLVAFVFLKNRIARWSERPTLHVYLGGVYFMTLFTTLSWIITMPWALYIGYYREHAYDLSNLSLPDWFVESLKGQLIYTVGFSVVGTLLFLGIRRFPRHWWMIAAGVAPFLMLLVTVFVPVFVAPVFNTYQPLKDPKIRDPILSMARANGVPAGNVYEFDASKQTKRVSANVSGALGTIRVSLNDNLLKRCTPAEIQAVMGHELGHYVLNHGYKLVVYFGLLTATTLAGTYWIMGTMLRRWGGTWRLQGPADLATVPLLIMILSCLGTVATPVSNSIVRTTEAEADAFGLNAAREPDGFAAAALMLSEYRKLAPGPWEEIIFFDHPSGYNRILRAMRWKAEHLAEINPPASVAPSSPK